MRSGPIYHWIKIVEEMAIRMEQSPSATRIAHNVGILDLLEQRTRYR